jgi:hypothetical protein
MPHPCCICLNLTCAASMTCGNGLTLTLHSLHASEYHAARHWADTFRRRRHHSLAQSGLRSRVDSAGDPRTRGRGPQSRSNPRRSGNGMHDGRTAFCPTYALMIMMPPCDELVAAEESNRYSRRSSSGDARRNSTSAGRGRCGLGLHEHCHSRARCSGYDWAANRNAVWVSRSKGHHSIR